MALSGLLLADGDFQPVGVFVLGDADAEGQGRGLKALDAVFDHPFVKLIEIVHAQARTAAAADFADDGDNLRSLWWLSLTGTVVRVNGFTGEPSLTDNEPNDYEDAACDACGFWDDPSVCEVNEEPPDPPTVSVPICSRQIDVPIAAAMIGMCGVRCLRRGHGRL